MRLRPPRRHSRGITLVEMMTVIIILGLVLSMIGLEFYGVVSNTLHTRANMDAESMARVTMSKVSNEMRLAFPDFTDNLPQKAVVQPGGSPATPGPIAEFFTVEPGSLVPGAPICGPTHPNANGPCPPFNDVVIQINPKIPGELDETVTPVGGATPLPIVLGRNVTGFVVTPSGGTEFNVQITVSAPSVHCVSKACSFTLNNAVYVGGFTK